MTTAYHFPVHQSSAFYQVHHGKTSLKSQNHMPFFRDHELPGVLRRFQQPGQLQCRQDQ